MYFSEISKKSPFEITRRRKVSKTGMDVQAVELIAVDWIHLAHRIDHWLALV